jgi:hypothetical protein
MLPNAQTWIPLQTLIQKSFQHSLNSTAHTAGHQGYAPALLFQKNAFRALVDSEDDNDDTKAMATQVAALMYQSQLTDSTAVKSSVCQEQQLVHLASQQNMMHENMHQIQIIAGLNAVAFNVSDEG